MIWVVIDIYDLYVAKYHMPSGSGAISFYMTKIPPEQQPDLGDVVLRVHLSCSIPPDLYREFGFISRGFFYSLAQPDPLPNATWKGYDTLVAVQD